ncbi:hypothetical protein [Plantactinospora sp. KBS50]|uniref:hypothetical protein n=1 Tax=Plantactinospora sp. KBS50 TaxID=2024580 RepID=UPI000BAAFE3E|nr:hypothetical protein [Plantactinospora sp. KBS50]ASW57283.1 hypothetical protein CIK06_28790 [Plantactinospora sp. KBS50]
MDYRDWASGELVRRERQRDAWRDGPSETSGDETGRPAARRGLPSAERYVPAWAREDSGSAAGGSHYGTAGSTSTGGGWRSGSTGGGRHRQEDADESPSGELPAARQARWQTTETTGGWHREDEPTGWSRRLPRQSTAGREPVSPTGASWLDQEPRRAGHLDQEPRPVGRRRARDDEDRTGTHRALPSEDQDEPYAAEPVTGIGAWESPTSTGGWSRRAGGTQWEESTSTGGWSASASTSGWKPSSGTGGWGTSSGTGGWGSASAGASAGGIRGSRSDTERGRAGRSRERESRHDHAADWDRTPAVDPWARPDDTSTAIGRWDRDAGRFVEVEPQSTRSEPERPPGRGRLYGQERTAGRDGPRAAVDRGEPPAETDVEEERRYGRRETFWSGTRLAGDDPRWMGTPASAPSSPVVDFPRPGSAPPPAKDPRRSPSSGAGVAGVPDRDGPGRPASGRTAPAAGRADLTAGRAAPAAARRGAAAGFDPGDQPGRGLTPGPSRPAAVTTRSAAARSGATGGAAARSTANRSTAARSERWPPASVGLSRMPARLDAGLLLDGERGSMPAALLCTVLWYAVPVLVLVGWLTTLDSRVPTGCVTDVTGGGCQSPRTHALVSLLGGVPQFGAALLASLFVAILLRRASGAWRSMTVGLAAAVVGGGLSTVIFSAMTGTG